MQLQTGCEYRRTRMLPCHFADDYGIVVRAVGLGLGEDCSAGLLQRVLSSIGGKRPSPYPLSVELRSMHFALVYSTMNAGIYRERYI